MERHQIQPHPYPRCHPEEFSGYVLQPAAPAAGQPFPAAGAPDSPVNGETLASFPGRLAAANQTSLDALLRRPSFLVPDREPRWHDDRSSSVEQLTARADDAAACLAVVSGSTITQASTTRFPPSAGSANLQPGPSPHPASARQTAASGSRYRCTFPPATRSASGTASGCPDREHRNSASATAPTSWMQYTSRASLLHRSADEQLIYARRIPGTRKPGRACVETPDGSPHRVEPPAGYRDQPAGTVPGRRLPRCRRAAYASRKSLREQSSLAQAAPASRRKRGNQAFGQLRIDNTDSS